MRIAEWTAQNVKATSPPKKMTTANVLKWQKNSLFNIILTSILSKLIVMVANLMALNSFLLRECAKSENAILKNLIHIAQHAVNINAKN